ncbi:MAG: hypothetical protein GF353_26130 [Candidatus Lokiarchaeota archaeon]|nr:hypothetical protein [Candidatus Lokiarchaeota archaeon]
MSILLIPVAPLSRTKSRLRDCFSKEQLKALTIAMFKDLGTLLKDLGIYDEKIVYCNNSEILDLAEEYNLIGIKEKLTTPRQNFATVIQDLNSIAIDEFNAKKTVFTFLDLILISQKNFKEIHSLMKKYSLVVCPAIHSAGVSILGRTPPEIVSSACFSNPKLPSFVALLNEAQEREVKQISIYDSFRASFDVDIKQDLILAFEYLKIFNLMNTETFSFLKQNLKLKLQKKSVENNREFTITRKS